VDRFALSAERGDDRENGEKQTKTMQHEGKLTQKGKIVNSGNFPFWPGNRVFNLGRGVK
jgi:hypothetical protein